jgi:hypothetical protein
MASGLEPSLQRLGPVPEPKSSPGLEATVGVSNLPVSEGGVASTFFNLGDAATSGEKATVARQRPCLEPIPPPGEVMQYRAIGLIEGQYIPSPDRFTRGVLRTSDGLDIHAVLLGRVMSLVRKHLRPERNYLWVVYPRTRDKGQNLHVQLMGVWAPEEMGQTLPEGSCPRVVPDWFSIRGEVVFQSQERGFIIVKIRRSHPQLPSPTHPLPAASSSYQQVASPGGQQQAGSALPAAPQAFKLRLLGSLPGKGVGIFWDLQARRRGSQLYIESATPIGPVPRERPQPQAKRSTSPSKPKKKPPSAPRRAQQPLPSQPGLPLDPAKAAKPPKPTKKKRP